MTRLARALVGWLWWWVVPVRKAEAVANLTTALPGVAPGPLLRRAVGVVLWSYVELALGVQARVTGPPIPPGAIGLLAHGTAWDPGLLALGRAVPTTVFVNEPTARWAARFITRKRRDAGLELLSGTGSFARGRAALSEGRLVVFALDQRHNAGIPVPFLGRPAWTSAAFAVLAQETRAPVFGLWPCLDASGRHVLRAEPLALEVPETREEGVPHLTRQALDWYAKRVTAEPGGWWWLHRRWKKPQ